MGGTKTKSYWLTLYKNRLFKMKNINRMGGTKYFCLHRCYTLMIRMEC